MTLVDSRNFKGLTDDHHDSRGVSYVETATANELRVGKHVIMNGFPCKIKELHRAAPGKHGHAKLRTVGYGIFDGKKRETIFIAQHAVQVPLVQKHQGLLALTTDKGLQMVENNVHGLPDVLMFPEEMDDHPQAGQNMMLSIIVSCGHYKITESRAATAKEEESAAPTSQSVVEQVAPQVLSKKEARKLKRRLQKDASNKSPAISISP